VIYRKRCETEMLLLQITKRRWYTAYRKVAISMTLSDFQGHSTIAGLVKCSFCICSSCQDFNWHRASRGPSALAELLVLSGGEWITRGSITLGFRPGQKKMIHWPFTARPQHFKPHTLGTLSVDGARWRRNQSSLRSVQTVRPHIPTSIFLVLLGISPHHYVNKFVCLIVRGLYIPRRFLVNL